MDRHPPRALWDAPRLPQPASRPRALPRDIREGLVDPDPGVWSHVDEGPHNGHVLRLEPRRRDGRLAVPRRHRRLPHRIWPPREGRRRRGGRRVAVASWKHSLLLAPPCDRPLRGGDRAHGELAAPVGGLGRLDRRDHRRGGARGARAPPRDFPRDPWAGPPLAPAPLCRILYQILPGRRAGVLPPWQGPEVRC